MATLPSISRLMALVDRLLGQAITARGGSGARNARRVLRSLHDPPTPASRPPRERAEAAAVFAAIVDTVNALLTPAVVDGVVQALEPNPVRRATTLEERLGPAAIDRRERERSRSAQELVDEVLALVEAYGRRPRDSLLICAVEGIRRFHVDDQVQEVLVTDEVVREEAGRLTYALRAVLPSLALELMIGSLISRIEAASVRAVGEVGSTAEAVRDLLATRGRWGWGRLDLDGGQHFKGEFQADYETELGRRRAQEQEVEQAVAAREREEAKRSATQALPAASVDVDPHEDHQRQVEALPEVERWRIEIQNLVHQDLLEHGGVGSRLAARPALEQAVALADGIAGHRKANGRRRFDYRAWIKRTPRWIWPDPRDAQSPEEHAIAMSYCDHETDHEAWEAGLARSRREGDDLLAEEGRMQAEERKAAGISEHKYRAHQRMIRTRYPALCEPEEVLDAS